jgi:hypothetical protein
MVSLKFTVEIESGRVNGTFPKRALTHVHECNGADFAPEFLRSSLRVAA